jgi:two-component system sensor histidine kinase/response regulator
MPGMDGYEVCEHLKSNPHTAEVPIIFLTAKTDLDSIIKGFEIGGQDYITKPFNAAELLARVNNHLLIKKQSEKLKALNNKLEERVKERTIELENANHKLSVLDKAKSNFLSVISHEIRTPLNGVIGLTELLNETNIDDSQREYIENLKDVSKRLYKFSETALLITTLRIDSYKTELMPVSIHTMINESIEDFNKRNPNANLNILTSFHEDKIMVNADSELMKTCFSQLIDNAFNYAGDGSELEIKTFTEEQKLSVTFTDNGPGFNRGALENIFETFSAGDVLHNEGSGLGLAATKLALEANDATIEASNSETGGARIKIKMNYAKE